MTLQGLLAYPRPITISLLSVLMVTLCTVGRLTGQLDAANKPDTYRDDCVEAAFCNLIKGDLRIDTQGSPGPYYELAIANLRQSMKYKKCHMESIFAHCKRSRLECEADIDQLARNSIRIPMDHLVSCPYTTWPYMLFSCQNYKNWPESEMVNEIIPKECRSCQTQCYLVEEFEAFRRNEGLTDFPSTWEIVKNTSNFIKSEIQIVERRQGTLVYPWVGLSKRDPGDVVDTVSFELKSSSILARVTLDLGIDKPNNIFH